MALLAGAAAVAGHKLFSYNRQNFFFDKDQKQEREYQSQKLRIKQFGLYREDIRDMMELTCSKMDVYLIVNTLLLTFCIILFTEGRPFKEEKTGVSPTWLLYMYGITNVSAFTYFLLSIWLSIHASVAAHSFGVRMLTQFVRLPVPNKRQLDAGKATGTDYEASGASTLFRVPVVKQQWERLTNMMNDEPDQDGRRSTATNVDDDAHGGAGVNSAAEALTHGGQAKTGSLKHVQTFRQLQANWQAYDAYARVTMTLGVNQLILATAYYIMQILIVEVAGVAAALAVVLVLGYTAWLMVRLDLYTDRRMLRAGCFLLMAPLVMMYVAVAMDQCKVNENLRTTSRKILVPLSMLCSLLWILVIIHLAKPDEFEEIALPVRFRSVLYLDVFGWLDKEKGRASREALRSGQTMVLTANAQVAANKTQQQSHLDTLQEDAEGELVAAQPSTRSMGGSYLPPSLQSGLGTHCWKQRAQIHRNLVRWKSQSVKKLLQEDPEHHLVEGAIAELQQQFQILVSRLQEADPNGNDSLELHQPPIAQVWLHLQWEVGSEHWSYYHCVEDGKVSLQKPATQDSSVHVLELMDLQDDLDSFTHHIEAVESSDQVPSLRTTAEATSARRPARQTMSMASTESDTDAQETRFGGQQAIHGGRGFQVSATAGDGFHPNRRGTESGSANTVKRPPGQIPWRTFYNGSMIIVFAWIMGIVWVLIEVVAEVDIPLFTIKTGWRNSTDSELSAVATDWPDRFFTPSGIACHPKLGSSMLVSEKYAVHELRLMDGGTRAEIRPALQECLAGAPGFHVGGLQGVSVECFESGGCHALLSSAKGKGALRCPLDAEGRGGGQGAQLETRSRWRALVAGDGEGAAWALGERGLVRLEAREGVESELVPEMEVPHASSAHLAVESLHVIGGRAVLGLDPAGRLHSWPLRKGQVSPQTYALPMGGPAWSGVCATSDDLYLVSAPSSDGPAGVWRTPLQPELRA